jgi:hypothetical protein
MAELVEVYADFPLGTTDAAVVAVAERLGSPRSLRWTAAASTRSGRGMPEGFNPGPDLPSCRASRGWTCLPACTLARRATLLPAPVVAEVG